LGPHHLHRNLTLRQVGEYVHVVKAFIPLALASTSSKNIIVLQAFHLLGSSLPCLDSLMGFYPEIDFKFSLDIIRLTFIHSIHLLIKGLLGMVLEHLQDLFDPKDLVSGFSQLFMVCS